MNPVKKKGRPKGSSPRVIGVQQLQLVKDRIKTSKIITKMMAVIEAEQVVVGHTKSGVPIYELVDQVTGKTVSCNAIQLKAMEILLKKTMPDETKQTLDIPNGVQFVPVVQRFEDPNKQ